MRYELRVTAYDALDEIWVSAVLMSTEHAGEGGPRAVLHYLTQVRGTGETDPRVWMRDALLALLEDV
jgi:hypothetical protein